MMIRPETPGDVAAIRAVEEEAFGRSAEAQLVDDLRDAGDSAFSLVAVEGETVIGHAMFSRLQAPFPALALGPVAVLLGRQQQSDRYHQAVMARRGAANALNLLPLSAA